MPTGTPSKHNQKALSRHLKNPIYTYTRQDSFMLNKIQVSNFGPITNLEWKKLGKINLIIGENGSGKTFLLKAIYSALKTVERFKRGHEMRSSADILSEKLYWTFQVEKFRELVQKGTIEPLSFSMWMGKKPFLTNLEKTLLSKLCPYKTPLGRVKAIPSFSPPRKYSHFIKSFLNLENKINHLDLMILILTLFAL